MVKWEMGWRYRAEVDGGRRRRRRKQQTPFAICSTILGVWGVFHGHWARQSKVEHGQLVFTSSTSRRGMWKKLSSSFNLTCVCKSGKHSLMFFSTSLFSCEHMEPLVQLLSLDVPSLLCSHSDVVSIFVRTTKVDRRNIIIS